MIGAEPRDWSIRWRLTRGVLAVVLVGWLGTILLTIWFLDHEMSESFDAEMALAARTTLVGAETAPGSVLPRIVGLSDDGDGSLLRLSVTGAAVPTGPWPQPKDDGFSDVAGWRVLRLSGDGVIVEIAQARTERREELLEAASGLLVLVLPMVLFLAWGITRILARTLAPMEQVATAIGARKPDDLSPVTGDNIPRELRPLTQGLNAYLARIEALRQSERSFIANAAHELRTPVAAIRARLERNADAENGGAVRMLDDLTRRVERLLQLSRSDAGVGLGRGPSDLIRILRMLIDDAARKEGVTILFDDGDLDQLLVPQDADALGIVLRNLLENAIEHGTGKVRIALAPNGRLAFENPTRNTQLLAQPFSKGAGSNGIGLGLAIVDSLAASMGLPITKGITDGMARVVITFDAAKDPARPDGGDHAQATARIV